MILAGRVRAHRAQADQNENLGEAGERTEEWLAGFRLPLFVSWARTFDGRGSGG